MHASTRMDLVPNVDTHIAMVPAPPAPAPVPTPMPLIFSGMVFGLAEIVMSLVPDALELVASVADAVTGAEAGEGEHGAVGEAITEAGSAAMTAISWITDPVGSLVSHARGTTECGRVKVNGLWATKAGDPVHNLVMHQLTCPFPLVPPPSDSADLDFGALGVFFENQAPVRHMELSESCSVPIDMPTMLLSIPKGRPCLILRPPAPDPMAMAQRALRAAARAVIQARDAFAQRYRRAPWMIAFRARAHAVADRIFRSGTLHTWAYAEICRWTGEPVDVGSGRVASWNTDLALPGPIPLVIGRNYDSSLSWRDGCLGRGWHFSLDQRVWQEPGRVCARLEDGREISIDTTDRRGLVLAIGDSVECRVNQLTVTRRSAERWELRQGSLVREFAALGSAHGPPRGRERASRADGSGAVREPMSSSGEGHGRLIRIRDLHGRHAIELTYDRQGRLEWARDSMGRLVGFEHDARGCLRALKAPLPHQRGWYVHRRYEVDSAADLLRVTDSLGASWTYEYVTHLVVRAVDRTGLTWHWEYDGIGASARCTRTWGMGPGEQQTSLMHRVLHYLPGRTIVEDGFGYPTTYELDATGLVVKEIDPLGRAITTERDPETAALLSTTDSMGRTTRYVRDAADRLLSTHFPDGTSIEIARDSEGRPVCVTDASGAEHRYRWSHFDELLESTDPLGAITRYEWSDGRLERITAPGGRTTRVLYAGAQVVGAVLPNGAEQRQWHDGLGRVIKARDARGAVHEVQQDTEGRVLEERSRAGVLHRYRWDAEGNCTHWSDGERELEIGYGNWHKPIWRREGGAVVRMEHDVESELVAVINEAGERTELVRNPCGELVEERDWVGRVRRYTRDASGAVTHIESASGTTEIAYDVMGRPIRTTYADGETHTHTYDTAGRLVAATTRDTEVRFERDLVGRVVREWSRDGQAEWTWIERTWGLDGEWSSMSSGLGAVQRVERDALGLASRVRLGRGVETRFERDALGLETARSTGALRIDWAFDAAARPTERRVGGDLRRFHWRSDERLAGIEDERGMLVVHQHDARGRVVGQEHRERGREIRALDSVSNPYRSADGRDRRYGPGGALLESDGIRYEHDAGGRRISKILSDGATWRYRWSAAGKLTEVERPDGVVVRNRYDAFSRRARKTVIRREGESEIAIADTRYVWDAGTLLHEVVTDDRGTTTTTTWHSTPDTATPLARERHGRTAMVAVDQLGAPTELYELDPEGREDPTLIWRSTLDLFGRAHVDVGEPTDCPLRWPGQLEDPETGLYENRFRHYDPEVGRYISTDPIGIQGGLNVYAYVDDPLTYADPLGLSRKVCTAADATTARAQALIDQSEGAPGPGTNVGHSRSHVPRTGQDPRQLSQARPTKAHTTVYRHERHALQDLRDALVADAQHFDALPVGGVYGGTYRTSGPRQGFDSTHGATPTDVTFDHVTIRIARMPDGRLHLLHFSPLL